jgi:ABC-type proline/glycine betaine transport system ATPase subunit
MSSKCSSYKCKVCYDAGKPAADYNSHYVKSADRSKVTCPIILAIKCRYCGEMGHTLKYCAKQQQKPAASNASASASNKAKAKNVVKASAIENMYSILDDDEDEDEDVAFSHEVMKSEQNFVPFFQKGDEEQQVQKSYADAVNAEPAPPAPAPVIILSIPKLVRAEVKRWADYSDSEDEDVAF